MTSTKLSRNSSKLKNFLLIFLQLLVMLFLGGKKAFIIAKMKYLWILLKLSMSFKISIVRSSKVKYKALSRLKVNYQECLNANWDLMISLFMNCLIVRTVKLLPILEILSFISVLDCLLLKIIKKLGLFLLMVISNFFLIESNLDLNQCSLLKTESLNIQNQD
jgi:hypothetical protein